MSHAMDPDIINRLRRAQGHLGTVVGMVEAGRAVPEVVQQLQAGTVLSNRTVTDPLAPFGGLKLSGLGRENGIFGLESFLEPQAIIAG